jgi:hypothetical protein
MSIKLQWLEDVDENALMRGKTAALILVFEKLLYASESKVKTETVEEWVAVPLSAFERITKNWKK